MDPRASPPESAHSAPKLVAFFPPSSVSSSSSTVTLDVPPPDFPSKPDNNGHGEDDDSDDVGEELELSLRLCTGGKKEKEKERETEREKSAMPGLIRGRSTSFLPVSAMDDGNPNVWNKASPLCRSASLSFTKAASSSSSPPSWVLSYGGSGSLFRHHPYQEMNSITSAATAASAAAVAVSTPPLVRHYSCGDVQQKQKDIDDEQQRQRRLEARKRRKILMEEKQMKRAKKERTSLTPPSSSLSISRKNSNAEICSRNLEADIAGSERRSMQEKKKSFTVEERESALVNQTKASLQEDRDNGSSAEGSELHQGELNPGDCNHGELNCCELNQGESAVSDTSTSHVTSPSASVSVPVLPNPSRVPPSLPWQIGVQSTCLQDGHTTTTTNTHMHVPVISSFRPPFPPLPPSASIPWLSPMRPPLPIVSTRVSNQPDAYGSAKDSESRGSRDCSDEKRGAGIVEAAESTRAVGNPSLVDKPSFLHRTLSDCAEQGSPGERSATNTTAPSPLLRHQSLPVKPRPEAWKKGKLDPWSNLAPHPVAASGSRRAKEEEEVKGIQRSYSVGEAVLQETVVEQRGSASIGVSGAELPWVSTTGPGPDGKTVNGVMYILNRSQVRIVCNCHHSHMTPGEFVQHAGGTNLSNPERSIFVNPFPYATQVAPPPVS